jgi:hypothetical protein
LRRCGRTSTRSPGVASPSTIADNTAAHRSHSAPDSIPAYRCKKLLRPSARQRLTFVCRSEQPGRSRQAISGLAG